MLRLYTQINEAIQMDVLTANKPGSLDLCKYCISQTYGDTLGNKELVTHVSVGNTGKGLFF